MTGVRSRPTRGKVLRSARTRSSLLFVALGDSLTGDAFRSADKGISREDAQGAVETYSLDGG